MKKNLHLVIILCLTVLQRGCSRNMLENETLMTETNYSVYEIETPETDVCVQCLELQAELNRINQILSEIHMNSAICAAAACYITRISEDSLCRLAKRTLNGWLILLYLIPTVVSSEK